MGPFNPQDQTSPSACRLEDAFNAAADDDNTIVIATVSLGDGPALVADMAYEAGHYPGGTAANPAPLAPDVMAGVMKRHVVNPPMPPGLPIPVDWMAEDDVTVGSIKVLRDGTVSLALDGSSPSYLATCDGWTLTGNGVDGSKCVVTFEVMPIHPGING